MTVRTHDGAGIEVPTMMRFAWMLQLAVVLVGPSVIYAYMHRAEPSRAFRGAGLVLAGTYVGFFTLFVIGETVADPGGWSAVGLVAAWLAPMAVLSLLAWRRPGSARPVLVGLVAVLAGLYVWSALAPDVWRSFEDDTGPVRGVLTLALTAPAAVLARRYLRDAGWLLLALGVLPYLVGLGLQVTDGARIPWSLVVLDAPPLMIGALLLASTRLDASRRRGATRRGGGRTTRRHHPAR